MNFESPLIEKYLNKVIAYSEKSGQRAEDIRDELKDHLLKKIEILTKKGISREEAILSAIRTHGHPASVGEQYRHGFRWIDIRSRGTARGFIAIGPRAFGVFAFGGIAMGVFPFGGLSIGLFSLGGLSIGFIALGGIALGGLAVGGLTIGIIATGGFGLGAVASGGKAFALWAPQEHNAISYYSKSNVPAFLNSLTPFLKASYYLLKHILVYNLLVITISILAPIIQYKHFKKFEDKKDWMIES